MSRINLVGAGVLAIDPFPDIGDGVPPCQRDWLEALPLPAGLIEFGPAGPRMVIRNRTLERISEAGERACLTPLREQVRVAVAGADLPLEFPWTEPGPAGRHFQVHVAPIAPEGPFLLTLIDRTTAVETERSLRFEMLHDSLTGLRNRLGFTEAVETALAQEDGVQRVALIALDLIRFSRINASVGALFGDELIITVARRLLAAAPEGSLLARTSGDEFSLLMRLEEGPGDVLHVARRLQAILAAPLRLAEFELRIDSAIGCALNLEGGRDATELLRNARFALKRAKQLRGIEVFQPEAAKIARSRFSLETELRHAIDDDALSVAFQPLVDLASGRVKGFEALARWHHPTRGEVPPTEFIPVAEESGLIMPLGRWVLDRAVHRLADWDAALGTPHSCYVSVNVSPVQLERDQVAEAVAGALDRHGIHGSRLTLELTESSIIANPDRAGVLLAALKALSCRLAMDDFGTGYSNLAHLQRLPIDVLKIDRSFVTDMIENGDSSAIVRAILGLASALGMTTIAEGIETAAVARALAGLGCATGQGFHFARPLSPEEALAYLRANG